MKDFKSAFLALFYLFQAFENFTCKRLGKGRRSVSHMYIHEVPNAFLSCKYRFAEAALSVQQPSFLRSELLIESEARSAESQSDVAPNARRRAQADANLGQVLLLP